MKTQTLLAAAALLVSATSCDDMPSGDITDPHVWGEFFLDKYRDELVIDELEPGPTPLAEPRVVLLITGVTIPAEWFGPIEARLERDGFIPVTYEPPDLLSGDLFDNAEWLAEKVDQVRTQYGQEKIDILAECTGGLIARHYIQSMGGDQYVSRMVTFISPQHGLPKAPLAYDVAGWPALEDLSPGSEFLDAVNEAPLPENVPVTSIYTCTDEYIQPYETSIIPGAHNIGLCSEFVGHFQFFYDPAIYLIMHDALTEPVPGDDVDPPSTDPSDPDTSEPGGDDASAPDADEPSSGAIPGESAGCSTTGAPPSADALFLIAASAFVLANRRRRQRGDSVTRAR